MAWGGKIRNGNNVVVIDQGYSNHGLRAKGVANAASGTPTGTGRILEFTFTAVSPVLAVRSAVPVCVIFTQKLSSTSIKYWVFMESINADLEWYLFDRAQYAAMDDVRWGLKVRNPGTMEVIFDSRMKYLNVKNVVAGTRPLRGSGSQQVAVSIPTGKLAVVLASGANEFTADYFGPQGSVIVVLQWMQTSFRALGTSNGMLDLTTWQILTYDANPGDPVPNFGPPYYNLTYCAMLVDVTGF